MKSKEELGLMLDFLLAVVMEERDPFLLLLLRCARQLPQCCSGHGISGQIPVLL